MPVINNILNVRVNQVGSASCLNFGDTVNVSPISQAKTLGGSTPIGDFPRNIDFERNVYFDPDLYDQSNFGSGAVV